jgi:hypothetical protein
MKLFISLLSVIGFVTAIIGLILNQIFNDPFNSPRPGIGPKLDKLWGISMWFSVVGAIGMLYYALMELK